MKKGDDTAKKLRIWIKSYSKDCDIYKEEFEDISDKDYFKGRDHCHYIRKDKCATHGICCLRYRMPIEIPAVMHNRLN